MGKEGAPVTHSRWGKAGDADKRDAMLDRAALSMTRGTRS